MFSTVAELCHKYTQILADRKQVCAFICIYQLK